MHLDSSFYKLTSQKAISENDSLNELAAIHTSPQGKGMSQLQKVGKRKALCKFRTIVGAQRKKIIVEVLEVTKRTFKTDLE